MAAGERLLADLARAGRGLPLPDRQSGRGAEQQSESGDQKILRIPQPQRDSHRPVSNTWQTAEPPRAHRFA